MQTLIVRILLLPFSLLYGLIISLRGFFYRIGLLRASSFDIPVISVGNLSVGGAGKTPHIEYLIRLLSPYIHVGTLSRGYKRKTDGFWIVQPNHTAEQVGDEPLQFRRKFRDIQVAVGESRILAIPQMIMDKSDLQVILLDDAFQHLAVKPGLNILLTEFSHPFTRDYLMPSGRLREWRSAYQRADIIIVTKCPAEMTELQRDAMIHEIHPYPHQRVYFSYYRYGEPYHILKPSQKITLTADLDVLLVCAIARADYLLEYLEPRVNEVNIVEFEDHHYFSNYDVGRFQGILNNMESPNKIILTTEKDAMRLELHRAYLEETQMPVYALPVEVAFHFGDASRFDEDIRRFLLDFKV